MDKSDLKAVVISILGNFKKEDLLIFILKSKVPIFTTKFIDVAMIDMDT